MKHFLLIFLFSMSVGAWAQGSSYDFVQVAGEGEVKVKPDFVTLNVTVYSRASSAQQAEKANAREMVRVDKVLKQEFKIDPKDLQTSAFQVTPQYEYVKDRPVYKGMSVVHTVNVKFRKVDEVGNLLDKLVSGSNQEGFGVRVEDIAFGTDQMKTYQLRALGQAMDDAKIRAQALAKASGRILSGARKVVDLKSPTPGIEPIRSFGKATFSSMAQDVSPTQVSAGEITVHAQVQVEYELK